jgi:hypothetical protein
LRDAAATTAAILATGGTTRVWRDVVAVAAIASKEGASSLISLSSGNASKSKDSKRVK